MDVVVDVLASNDGSDGVGVCGLADDTLILELGSLASETVLNLPLITVLVGAVLNSDQVVGVLLGEDLAVGHGLDRGVVVVLVDFFVDGSDDLLVLSAVDGLVQDSRGDGLVDGGVMVSGLGPVREKNISQYLSMSQCRVKRDCRVCTTGWFTYMNSWTA